jgi:hypothetical protein
MESFPPLNNNNDSSVVSSNAQELQNQQMNDMLQEWMGMPGAGAGADEATAQQLLRVLEQQRQQNAAYAAAEEAMQMRPEKHYLTISQDGKFYVSVVTTDDSYISRSNSERYVYLARHRKHIGSNEDCYGLRTRGITHDFGLRCSL